MKIAVTGATGQLGRIVVEKLREKGLADEVVALVRSPEKAVDLGIEVREADYGKPETFATALEGIDKLLLISGNELGKRVEQHTNVIEAAKAAGVKHIVYTSLLRADTSTLILAPEHLATEEAIKNSGIPFTVLRNGWYTENYEGSVAGAVAGGVLFGSAGDGKVSSASREDYAEAAATVLAGSGHEGKIYELAGDSSYTLSDLAEEISKQSGKEIPYKQLAEPEYAAALKANGLPEMWANAYASFDVGVSHGELFDDGHQLSKLISRPTTPFSATITV